MSEIVRAEAAGGGELSRRDGQSKIDEYDLGDLVLELYTKGYKTTRIAKECNDVLAARVDGKQYISINHMNVQSFIKKHHKEVELVQDNNQALQRLERVMPPVMDKLNMSVNLIEDELDKLRNANSIQPINQEFFVSLLGELRQILELAANIQGKLQPSINFAVFSENINRLITVVENNKELDQKSKAIVLNLIADHMISNDLTKTVDGKIVGSK